jgi:hypothetical protein
MAHGRTRRTQVSSQGIEDLPAQGVTHIPLAGLRTGLPISTPSRSNGGIAAGLWLPLRWVLAALAEGVFESATRLPSSPRRKGSRLRAGWRHAGATESADPAHRRSPATALGHIPCNLGDSRFSLAEAARGVLFKYPREAQKLGLGPLKGLRTVEADEGQGAPQDRAASRANANHTAKRKRRRDGLARAPCAASGAAGREEVRTEEDSGSRSISWKRGLESRKGGPIWGR